MSDDLRERLLAAAEAADCSAPPWVRGSKHTIEAAMPIIEAELQKRDKEHFDSLVKAESECLEETEQLSAKLTETNQLLERTIEVLEGFPRARSGGVWWTESGQPLLDNLKALKKEATE